MSESIHYRTCNLCEAMCGLEIRHQGEDILSIRGDKDDILSAGHICPKAVALQDLHNDPDRLKTPVRRTADGWQEISWTEALDEVADRLKATQKKHGHDAVGIYVGNPTAHNHGAQLLLLPFLDVLDTKNRYSATSVDQLPQMVAIHAMFGSQALFPIPDINRTDYFMMLGTNPVASNGSIMTAPDIRKRLKNIQARNGKVVVIDPRRSETAALADEHQFIRPGGDTFLLLGMMHVLFAEERIDLGHMEKHIDGLDRLEAICTPWTPAKAARRCGIPAADIKRLAREFSDADSAVAYGRVGLTSSPNSGLGSWLMYVLNIVSGNLDREGGLMFTHPAMDVPALAQMAGKSGSFDSYRSRVKNLPEFGGEFPAVIMADEILTEGPGQIRTMITHAGNPVLSTPDGQRLDEALASLDFMVSIDLYINETTRHADIILPPTGHLEHGQFDPVFHLVAVHNTIKYSPPLFQPAQDSMHDWQILLELTTRLTSNNAISTLASRIVRRLVLELTDEGLIDIALRTGPYGQGTSLIRRIDDLLEKLPLGGAVWQKARDQVIHQLKAIPVLHAALQSVDTGQPHSNDHHDLTIKKLLKNPHGIDLGPLRPALPDRLFTANKRLDLVPEIYSEQIAKLDVSTKAPQWQMIGLRHLRSNNSWMHNSHRLVKGKPRCEVTLNPEDAGKLKIKAGDAVRISSRVGEIELPARISDEIMPGIICVPHGWGHGRKGVELSVAKEHAGVSVNDVVDPEYYDPLCGMAILNGVPVEVNAA